ncbi:MAG: 2-oxoacid:ferredoxin oxidoreductase subunit beta [Candidatus Marinimicrobia bacterium]|nr:2-oxoacid:ferredoxin oxidoreductase subunit beta [Candidatus Neomarinimicrobiota bacterium]
MNEVLTSIKKKSNGEVVTKLSPKEYKGKVDPDWCPGCGDFGLLNGVRKACAELGILPHKILITSGIGCSSNFPGYFNAYGMHTLHGRPVPVATGVKLANHELTVIAVGGDGDGYGIGGNHFIHTARRNVNINYFVMNNQIYGLTTGQISPTSNFGTKTKSTPFGSIELPLNPITTAIMAGATFVARAYTGDSKHMVEIIKQAILHNGFSHVDVFSPCVTYNKVNTHNFFKQRTVHLEDVDHDPTDWKAACEKAMVWDDEIYIGLFWQNKERKTLEDLDPVLDEGGPMALRSLGLSKDKTQKLIHKMM